MTVYAQRSDKNSPAGSAKMRLIAWALYAAGAWFLLLQLANGLPSPTIDASWQAVVNYLKATHAQFGRGVAWTYGPLGYLHGGGYLNGSYFSAETWKPFMVFQLLQKAYFVALLCWLGSRLPLTDCIVFLTSNTLIAALGTDAVPMLLILYTAVLLIAETRAAYGVLLVAAAFLAAESLIKSTFLFFAAFAVCGVAVYEIVARRSRVAPLLAPPIFFILLLLFWVIPGGQQLADFPAFLRNTLLVTAAYQEVLELPPQHDLLLSAIAAFALVWSYLATICWRRSRAGDKAAPVLFLIISAGLFLAWKQGFVRADSMHTPVSFSFLLAMVSAAGAIFGVRSDDRRPMAAQHCVAALAPLILLVGLMSYGRPIATIAEQQIEKLRWLVGPRRSVTALAAAARANADRYALPEIRRAVGSATVDVFGFEQAIALLNGLNFLPSPVLQGYLCTPPLAELNAEHYRSNDAPEFVIFKLQTIDGRFPALDNASVLFELLRSYQCLFSEGGYTLLQKRAAPRHLEMVQIETGEIRRGEQLPLPSGSVWCQLQIKQSLLGRIVRFLYQRPSEWLNVEAGEWHQFRLPAAMAGTAFLISPLLETNEDFVSLLESSDNNRQVKTIEVESGRLRRLLSQPVISYTLYRVQEEARE